mmetsp:Transcript_24605/g.79545  ORF Transcript_24605/g.79545 Transcript_24605/m.79545 type:complete len:80 (-) Transcript_24605:222-461(-)
MRSVRLLASELGAFRKLSYFCVRAWAQLVNCKSLVAELVVLAQLDATVFLGFDLFAHLAVDRQYKLRGMASFVRDALEA